MDEKNLGSETGLILIEQKRAVTPPKVFDHLADQYFLEITPKGHEDIALASDIALVLLDENCVPLCGKEKAQALLSAHEYNIMKRLSEDYFSPALFDSNRQRIEFAEKDGNVHCIRCGNERNIQPELRQILFSNLGGMDYMIVGKNGALYNNLSK